MQTWVRRTISAMVAVILAAGLARAQQGPEATPLAGSRKALTVKAAASPIRVDGELDEEAWGEATVVALSHEWFPSDNIEPPVATDCLVTFDHQHLYVAFRAHDPRPQEIRYFLADRDTALSDDTVGFFIDPFNDRRRAFEFRVNPLGVQADATYSDVGGVEDFSYDAIWASAGRTTVEGYTVEVAVPFQQLRFPRTAEAQTWGFLAFRNYPRSVLHEIKSTPNDRNLNCLVCKFDTLSGFQQIETGHNLEVVPTLTGTRTDQREDLAGRRRNGDEEVEAGLSARWGITHNVTLNATLNPDFSQVEADAAQLNVNERFALFFPERRPFFLEGADLFSTPFQAVFTRTVADPSFGLKLSGKEGASAFGVFLAEDRINNLILPGAESSDLAFIDQDVVSGVVRYRRDVGETSTLGLLYTGREADDYASHLYGLDGNLRLSDSGTLQFQLLGSRTDYPPELVAETGLAEDSVDGLAWLLEYTHSTRRWFWDFFSYDLEPGFRADSGFIPQVGARVSQGLGQRIFWGKPEGWFSRFVIEFSETLVETHDGETLEESANLVLTYEGPLQSVIRLGIRPNHESFQGRFFNDLRRDLLIQLQPRGGLSLELFLRGGEIIDFVNVRQSDFELARASVGFNLGRRISGAAEHSFETFKVHGEEFLRANLTQTTVRYHFNVKTFLRLILQYRDVERQLALFNPGIDLPAKEESFFSQFLFSLKLNPQTVLLVGYSDDHEGNEQIDLTQRSRTFFLKVGYAWLG